MATLQQIKFDIINTVRPLFTDDDLIRESHVEYLVGIQRALWIRNSIKDGDYTPANLTQVLNCIPLVNISAAECCDVDLGVGCVVKRTQYKIPKFVDLIDRPAITRISSPVTNEKIAIQYIKRNRGPYVGLGRFNKSLLYAYYSNEFIYIVDGKCDMNHTLQSISIEGVFTDPTELARVVDCDNAPCYNKLTDAYPMPDYMINYLKAEVIGQLTQSLQIPVDTNNDSSHKVKQ